jgi:hypothetical protein
VAWPLRKISRLVLEVRSNRREGTKWTIDTCGHDAVGSHGRADGPKNFENQPKKTTCCCNKLIGSDPKINTRLAGIRARGARFRTAEREG